MGLESVFERHMIAYPVRDPQRHLIYTADHTLDIRSATGESVNRPIAIVPIEPIDNQVLTGLYSRANNKFIFTFVDYVYQFGGVSIPFEFNLAGEFDVARRSPESLGRMQLRPSQLQISIGGALTHPITIDGTEEIPVGFLYRRDGVPTLLVATANEALLTTRAFDPTRVLPGVDDLFQNVINGTYDGQPFRGGGARTGNHGGFSVRSRPGSRPRGKPSPAAAPATPEAPKEAVKRTPAEIKAFLDERIIGQERAKRAMSVVAASYLHGFPKHCCFLGSTGTGKTETMLALSELLGIPHAKVDMTQVSSIGYVGADLNRTLVKVAREQKSEEPRGIIFLDEVDKIAGDADFFFGERLQNELLGYLGGSTIPINYSQAEMMGAAQGRDDFMPQSISTKNLLFILGGAFHGTDRRKDLRDTVRKRIGAARSGIGFGAPIKADANAPVEENLLHKTRAEDLVAYGFIPELVGRIPNLIMYDDLSRNDLYRILTEKKGNVIDEKRAEFKAHGYELEIERPVYDLIVDAAPRSTNARGLGSIVEPVLTDILFDADALAKDGKITVTPDLFKERLSRNPAAPARTEQLPIYVTEPQPEAVSEQAQP